MNSVIITDYGVALGKTGDRLVVRGPRPRLEVIEGGPHPPLHKRLGSGLLGSMRFEDYITVAPGVRSGKPCIKGTRITVTDVLEYLAGGMTEAQILADFPALKPEHIRACLAFAAARERRLASGTAR
jgi:uncharacterized protein (DUF433 family)